MTRPLIYQQIAGALRLEIAGGKYPSGAPLPSVRALARQWDCTAGTAQRAYAELMREGLVVTTPGQGTRVAQDAASRVERNPLRSAALVHQVEAMLMGFLTAGYQLAEVERAMGMALDRWRALNDRRPAARVGQLRFVGSHDPAISLVASRLPLLVPGWSMELRFAGSLGGLIALAQGDADLAGCHLWDAETQSYNDPFVRRLLPGRRVALLTLAERRLGLVTQPGNPLGLTGVADLARPGVRFVNRQAGAGTRVWLDAQLRILGIDVEALDGYDDQRLTHTSVAQSVAAGDTDAGLAVETAAIAFGLEFQPLVRERYDLVIPATFWSSAAVEALATWLASAAGQRAVDDLGGYLTEATGQVRWIG